jgi:hypothetical protein
MFGNPSHIAILGSGPTAYIAAKKFLDSGVTPTVFMIRENSDSCEKDPDIYQFPHNLSRPDKREFFRKKMDFPGVQALNASIAETKLIGGLGNFWGGVCFPVSYEELSRIGISRSQYDEYSHELIRTLNISSIENHLWREFESPSNSEYIYDKPILAMGTLNSAWNPRFLWNELVQRGAKIVWGYVEECVESEKAVAIFYRSNNDTIKNLEFEYVFSALGPFGNAKLILKHSPHLEKVMISDSAVEYRLVLTKFSRKSFDINFPVGCLRINGAWRTKMPENNLYIQFYELTNELLQFITPLYLRMLVTPFWLVLRYFTEIAVMLYPEESSDSIKLSLRTDGSFEFSSEEKKGQKNTTNPKFRRYMWKVGRISLPIKIRQEPGSSVHSGAIFSRNTKLIPSKRIQYLGSSSLARIPAGPITFASLLQCMFAVDTVLKNEIKT